MGAVAPPPHWIPEDDLLLKNAIEAGASLESLAKGAVQFSRRYTVQELQDHWGSLLYDPVVSEEASENMIVAERFGVINQLPSNKFGVKDIACISWKRKAESVRKYYYAMRKRIRIEPLDMGGISLASEPGYSNFRDGNEFLYGDCEVGNPASNILGAQGPDYSIRPTSLAEFGPHAAESTGNGPVPSSGGVLNHGQEDHCGEYVSNNLLYTYEENISLTGDCSEIPGIVQSNDLPRSELGDQSFHNFECSTPLNHMPIRHGSQDISAMHSNLKLEAPLPCDSMIDMASSTQEYLDVLFDLSDDEGLLYMDNDGNEGMEKSYLDGLSALLLDSPYLCDLSGSGLGEASVVADGHLVDRGDILGGGSYNEDLCDQKEVAAAQLSASQSIMKVGPEYRNGVICCTLNTEDPDIPSNDDVFLPYRFPSPTNSSGAHWALHDPSYLGSSSRKNFSSTSSAKGGHLAMKNTQKDSSVPSGIMGSFYQSDAGLRCRKDHGVKFKLPESSMQHSTRREAGNSDSSNHASLANVNANNFVTGVKGGPSEMVHRKNLGFKSLGPCQDKHKSSLVIHQSLQNNSVGTQSGMDGVAEIPNNGSSNVDLIFHTDAAKAIDHSLLSDQEELLSENEFDVPYFSDVEAMILDMDLSQDEFDLYTNPEVQRFQLEETKRTIIRLEQAADAFTHRAIVSQFAFAVLYGRFSRHWIKKTEVLLGRATDEVKVDIDLGREKNGGKISRRQATMKMDTNGTFHLKNLGRTPIYVNGKDVASGQSLGLTSGCLIEVRGLAFVFETNRKMIKQYIDSSAGRVLEGYKHR
ncbi:uncharacterized protein LOC121793558 isoform X1 [Salvia splendens]|uniref:uncharacterized protein LOC121793558 isoform X1 n=2 Tax=Salvia splendens TaxID=180675 RepID=UPI001C25DD84|nr:uncharacterized protein LOC121793558 isoform X1 [Salvia splendens]